VAWDFSTDPDFQKKLDWVEEFCKEEVEPLEFVFPYAVRSPDPKVKAYVRGLQQQIKEQGLWALFLDEELGGPGYGQLKLGLLNEVIGRYSGAPQMFGAAAPDTGNIEMLAAFGTDEQKKRWLEPLLAGEIRSAFAMTEPDVASSDATNIQTSITRDGDEYVVTGRKWWITGVADERCQVYIVMGKSAPDAEPYRRQSMILVPRDTPGVTIVRHLPVFGYQDQHGHSELAFDHARVPAANLIAGEGDGFAIAQARLGPGRIHHAMRAIGMAERALALMVERAKNRTAFGTTLADQGVVRELIAESRMEIDQVRLYVYKTAWLIDQAGTKAAQSEIAGIKVAAPAVATRVIDRAIEVFGGAGVGDDTPLAYFYAWARVLRIVDGPDAVHRRSIARQELRRERPFAG
jgi:acyl-CoA dehydrogenase